MEYCFFLGKPSCRFELPTKTKNKERKRHNRAPIVRRRILRFYWLNIAIRKIVPNKINVQDYLIFWIDCFPKYFWLSRNKAQGMISMVRIRIMFTFFADDNRGAGCYYRCIPFGNFTWNESIAREKMWKVARKESDTWECHFSTGFML